MLRLLLLQLYLLELLILILINLMLRCSIHYWLILNKLLIGLILEGLCFHELLKMIIILKTLLHLLLDKLRRLHIVSFLNSLRMLWKRTYIYLLILLCILALIDNILIQVLATILSNRLLCNKRALSMIVNCLMLRGTVHLVLSLTYINLFCKIILLNLIYCLWFLILI